jgi:hypothetical protein
MAMIHVILTNGKRITYNRCGFYNVDGEYTYFRETAKDKENNYCIAAVRTELIERIEWEDPCSVVREVVKRRKVR